MSIIRGAWSSSAVSGAMRCSFAQSSATSTRSAASSGGSRLSPSSGMKPYSLGSGASPWRYISLSLPSASSASFIASSEPRASPSGFSWVTSRKRSCERRASATAPRSFVVFWGELINELCHADPTLGRRIVFEGQLRGSLHSQLAREARLQDPVGGGEAGERPLPLRLGAEHAHEDTCVAQIGRGLDPRDRDEADPRVLQVAETLGDHLAHRLVHSSHPVAHARYSGGSGQLAGRTLVLAP